MTEDLPKIHRGKRNKPSDSKFCQQRLSAWRPLITARCVNPLFIFIGSVFIVLGIFLHLGALDAKEIVIPYTDCITANNTMAKEVLNNRHPHGPVCEYTVMLTEPFMGDVTFYYGLTNYYQNTRQYIRSRNDVQLAGTVTSVDDCEPFQYDNSSGHQVPIAPCGAVANSMFTDSYSMTYEYNGTIVPVPFTARNVVRPYEYRKYQNPKVGNGRTLCDEFQNTAKPKDWHKSICEVGNNDTGFGFENVDFIVWMNTAPLPDFRKVYRTLDRVGIFEPGLPAGNYTVRIAYNYNVIPYKSEKSFIIATTSWGGPKNYFLGIAYMTVGLFLFLLGIGLLVYDCFNRKSKRS